MTNLDLLFPATFAMLTTTPFQSCGLVDEKTCRDATQQAWFRISGYDFGIQGCQSVDSYFERLAINLGVEFDPHLGPIEINNICTSTPMMINTELTERYKNSNMISGKLIVSSLNNDVGRIFNKQSVIIQAHSIPLSRVGPYKYEIKNMEYDVWSYVNNFEEGFPGAVAISVKLFAEQLCGEDYSDLRADAEFFIDEYLEDV